MNKKDFKNMKIEGLARRIAWNSLDKYDQKMYINEAEKLKALKYWEVLDVELTAIKLAFDEIGNKDHMRQAQKNINTAIEKVNYGKIYK